MRRFSGARNNRLDLSVGIALGSAAQIALFVAPVLVLLSYLCGPQPMDLQFWPDAVVLLGMAALWTSGILPNLLHATRLWTEPRFIGRIGQKLKPGS